MQGVAVGYLVLEQLPATLSPVETAILIGVASIIVAKVVELVIVHGLLRRATQYTDTTLDDAILRRLHRPINVSILLPGLYLATLSLTLPERIDFVVRAVFLSIVTLVWAYALYRIGHRLITYSQQSNRLDNGFAPVFKNLWTFLLLLGVLFTVLSIWNIDITPLLASAGIAGIAIGFAAKDTIANFFGGISLYFDNTYKIGDYIVLDSGDEGTVTDVGIRSTTIQTRDDVLVTVPNSVLNSTRITNQSVPQTKKRISVPIGVAYGTDLDELEDILLNAATNEELVLEDPAPRARFDGFGDSSLNYRLLCWVKQPLDDAKTKHNLNRAIYTELNEAGIEIPYPQRDVHVDTDLLG